MTDITLSEKNIYNKYLAVTRSSQGKPFKLRKQFDDLDDHKTACLKKLSLFFNKFKHVDMDDFFSAPWRIYNDQPNIDLSFYVSQRALKVYTLYIQRKATTKPDTEEQLYDMKKTLQYILKFCVRCNIKVDDYIEHKTNNMYTFVDHLRQHNVNIYVLFGFTNFEKNLMKCDWDHVKFMLGDMADRLDTFRTNYLTSSRAKNFVQLGIHKIKQIQNNS